MFANTYEKRDRHYLQLRGIIVISTLLVVAGLTGSMAYGATQAAGPKPSAPHMNVWCVGNNDGVNRATSAPCNNGPYAYTSITIAISVAGAGDEIRIMSGDYMENVRVDKPVILYGGFSGVKDQWGNPRADCINVPGCTRINGAFSVISNFEVTLNGMTIRGNTANTNGGTITAYGSGIRLQNEGGTTVINGRWNIAAPAAIEINYGTQVAQAGTQVVGDGWLHITQDGVLSVSDNLTVPRIAQDEGNTRDGHVDGPGTLNVTNQYIWEGGQMRGTGITNLMPGATMDVRSRAFAAPGYMDYRTFNNMGTVNWGQGYALMLSHGATFNNNSLFNLQGLTIDTDNSFGTFNNSGVIRNPGAVYRQMLKPNANVVFNNTGNIDVPDAGGMLHFLQGTFNLQSGSTLTGAGVTQVGDQTGVWNVTGTVNARNVTVISTNNCSTCSGVTGTGTLNITGNLEWASGTMFGSGVTNLLAGATGRISTSNTLDARTFNNQGTVNFMDNSRLYFSNAAIFNNTGTANTGNNAGLWAIPGQTGTLNNTGAFNKLANHDFRVWAGATFVNAGTLNIQSPVGFGMHGGQFRQTTGGVLNLPQTDSSLWTNTLPHLLEDGVVRGIGSISSEGTIGTYNTGAEISPGSAPATAGTLTIGGNYTQGANGRLSIEVGGAAPGTGYDQLAVTGAADLAGTLNVNAINGYTPPLGSQYTVMTYQSHTGTFRSTKSGFNTAYNPTDITITVACVSGCNGFTDVPAGSTFYPFVTCLVNRGVISGYSDGTFRPSNPVSRAQLSKIVALSAGYSDPPGSQTFEDIAPGSTFYTYIQQLSSRGVIGGYACGGAGEPCISPASRPYFRPNGTASRGQTSKIVAIAKGLPAPPSGQQTFQDVAVGSTFWQWIEALSTAGAIGGYPCGGTGEPCVGSANRPYFRPSDLVTRGQASKIVANTFFPNCQSAALNR